MNLLVELRFKGLSYRQTLKVYDFAAQFFREELGSINITYQRLEVFFSNYRLILWLRLGPDFESDHDSKETLSKTVTAFCQRLKGNMPETWEGAVGILALLGKDSLSVRIDGLEAVSSTHAGGQSVMIKDTQHYWRVMGRHKILVDNGQREKYIRQLLAKAAADAGGEVLSSPVMNEVVVAAEHPVLKILNFPEQLELPEQLVMIILEQNKCFGIRNGQGALINTALYVCNSDCQAPDLEGALSRARADFTMDLEVSVEKRLLLLKDLCYLTGLGSYYDKQKRLQKIVLAIADQVDAGETVCKVARQASDYAKLDLTTKTCRTYPEYQGYMGGIIALKYGAQDMVAAALAEHWCPGKYSRKLPHTLVGALLGIADRLDDICGHYHQGEFKLSHYRSVTAWLDETIAILDSVALDVSMTRLLKFALSLYESQHLVPWREKDLAYLLKIFTDRLFYYLCDREYPKAVADALTAVEPDNVFVTLRKAEILTDYKNQEIVENCAEICKVLDRICAKDYNYEEAAREFLEQPEEKDLFELYLIVRGENKAGVESRRFEDVLARLVKLKVPALRFVNNVDLDTDDQPVRYNRLSLLAEIRQLYHQFADFSLL